MPWLLPRVRESETLLILSCNKYPPHPETLLVFYLPDAADWRAAVARLRALGAEPVASLNPYWDRSGLTFEDPDGFRIVLQQDVWRL